MLKTLARLFLERQLHRHGGSKPWKKGKKHRRWGHPYDPRHDRSYGHDPRYDRPYGYDPRYDSGGYGHHRPRGIKEMIVRAIIDRLLRR